MNEHLVATGNPEANGLLARFSAKYGVDKEKLRRALTETAFSQSGTKGSDLTTYELIALLTVAERYDLNPFLRELFAFKKGGVLQPMISYDGWIKIINRNPQFDGLEFHYSETLTNESGARLPSYCECTIYRKDRTHPTTAREYMSECVMNTSPVWAKRPMHMLRVKALKEAARLAFGITDCSGLDDMDEQEEKPSRRKAAPAKPPVYSNDDVERSVREAVRQARTRNSWKTAEQWIDSHILDAQQHEFAMNLYRELRAEVESPEVCDVEDIAEEFD